MSDKYDAIGKLEEELAQGFEGLVSHWEVRGPDPVLLAGCGGVDVEIVPQDDGRFRVSAQVPPEQVAQLLAVLTRRAAPAPARTRSRRLAAVLS